MSTPATRRSAASLALLGALAAAGCGRLDRSTPAPAASARAGKTEPETPMPANLATATFGAGCFWCVEAVFQRLDGVHSVVSGYAGGRVPNPTYRQVCDGTTGHAEVIQIGYDPSKVDYADLLEVFWKTHDPTTKDRQGNDAGPQYRSVIFTHDEEQRRLAETYRKELDASGAFAAPIVTEIVPFTTFFRAEEYHQNYFNENPDQPYCQLVVAPKVEKFAKAFKDRLKKDAAGSR